MKKFLYITIVCILIVNVSFFTFAFKSSNINDIFCIDFINYELNSSNTPDARKIEGINLIKDEVSYSSEIVSGIVWVNWFLLIQIPISTLGILFLLGGIKENFLGLPIKKRIKDHDITIFETKGFYKTRFDNRYKAITYILGTSFILITIYSVVEANIVKEYNRMDSLIATHNIMLYKSASLLDNVALDKARLSGELEFIIRGIHRDIELLNNRIWFCRFIQFFTWLAFLASIIMRWLRIFKKRMEVLEFLEQK